MNQCTVLTISIYNKIQQRYYSILFGFDSQAHHLTLPKNNSVFMSKLSLYITPRHVQ